ncbi:DUF6884 domain-containing protein [Burkholderia ubonensis]|uniref:DUF6884 domain-containing protein n=1 Tax=Burkholderia ubonensis TaxID=101571 RepID=UPI000753B962|nr:DUF6884 domain-containing protein [Burkholderia ubonensis]KVP17055.1 hypothetical protein WJ84_01915 [Burkholderia ubonensis]
MTSAPGILLMACSSMKLQRAAPAIDLYQGSMYSTYRANVRASARPHVVILSAKYGFIPSDAVIEPYDQLLTRDRADSMLSQLEDYMQGISPPASKKVMLAGGAEYRRVMRAAVDRLIERGSLAPDVAVTETSGGIGYQRQQLGAFLRRLAPALDIVGHHPNGTPLHRTMGGFSVEQSVDIVYPHLPGIAPQPAVIAELFEGPVGPTANVRLPDSKNPTRAYSWVALQHLRRRQPR